jgi:photosystem II stability/assembly factor-like uncharacterized protein
MKKILLLTTVLISNSIVFAQGGTWQQQTVITTGSLREAKDLEIVSLNNIQLGMLEGNPGAAGAAIKKFTNFYQNYNSVNFFTYLQSIGNAYVGSGVTAVSFPNTNNGWAVYGLGAPSNNSQSNIIKSTDGGDNWTTQYSPTFGMPKDLKFLDNFNGYVLYKNSILKTTDGGDTWQNYTIGGSLDYLARMFFIDINTGWAVGYTFTTQQETIIYKTIDGGQTWAQQSLNTVGTLERVFMLNANTGWTVGSNGIIYKTTDGGTNWLGQTSNTTDLLKSVYFKDTQLGWAVGGASTGKLLETTDGGTTWNEIPLAANVHRFVDIDFEGNNGLILDYKGGTWQYCPTYNVTVTAPQQVCMYHSWGATSISQSGTYTTTFTTATGCDSTVTATFIVATGDTTLNVTSCGPYVLNGTTYSFSGFYLQQLSGGGFLGCDSTITLNLTINAPFNPLFIDFYNNNCFINQNLPVGATYQWIDCNNGNAPIQGATSDVFSPTVFGSYSVITTIGACEATSNCIEACLATVSQSGNTLTASASPNSTFEWYDCVLGGSQGTGPTFTPTINGNYFAYATNAAGTCSSSTDCIEIIIGGGNPSSVNENDALNFNIYPNPANSTVSVSNLSAGSKVTIIDVMGKRVYATKAVNTTVDLSVETLSNGIYFVEIENNGAVAQKKLVVSK